MHANLATGRSIRGIARPSCCKHATADRHISIRAIIATVLAVFLVTGCYKRSVLPQSEGHITTPAAKPTLANVPPPARISTFVPPPKPAIKPPTYSVVVSEVPVKELLFALARDSKQNIDIHPGLQGLVSLNAINETLPAILDRVAKQVNLRYRVEGNTIIISTDTPYSKTYHVDYVNMIRNMNSTIAVSGQVTGDSGSGSGGGSQGGAAGTQSISAVTTTSTNDFWKMIETSIRSILLSSKQQTQTAEAKAENLAAARAEQQIRLEEAKAKTAAANAASNPLLRAGELDSALRSAGAQQTPATLLADDVIVNPISGTLTITATETQHNLVQDYLVKVGESTQRQVLIEATIVEVTLSEGYQGGIDWSRLAVSGGITFTQTLLGGFSGAATAAGASTGNSIAIGYSNANSPIGNISAAVKLLQEFGNTRVLSSPKLMALNNQTALLKVVDNLVYFEVRSQTTTPGTGPALTTFNTTAKTVAVGMVMGVTPQISDVGRVSLTVRPTISRVLRFRDDPNPSLVFAGARISNPVPEIQVREMESVLQIASGQTVIMGGLMQDNATRNREQVPGADKLDALGELFRFRDERATKTELVIFLRPTIITNPSLESDELKFFQRFLPQQTDTPNEAVPGEKTGATR